MKRLIYNDVKECIESFGYKLLSTEYKNANTKLKIKCENGHIFERTFSKFKQTQNCPYCTNTRKWSVIEIKEYLKNINYTLLSTEYKNNQTKLDMICSEGHKIQMTMGNIQQGKRCHICSRKIASENRKHNYEFVKKYIENEGYELLSKTYINQDEKLKMKCSKGHIFLMDFCHFKRGCRCPQCCKNKKMSHKEFLKKFYNQNLNAENIEILSEYINANTKIKCSCKIDGHIWFPTSSSLLNGCGCPQCNESKGEKRIRVYLERKNLIFKPQKRFDNLLGLGGGKLSYDFYLPSYNLLIEYQGGYHDGTVSNQTEEEFKKQQEHDKRKRDYAMKHNINLLEIWYYDFDNIEKILSQELNK